jgi:hypothetical protein
MLYYENIPVQCHYCHSHEHLFHDFFKKGSRKWKLHKYEVGQGAKRRDGKPISLLVGDIIGCKPISSSLVFHGSSDVVVSIVPS